MRHQKAGRKFSRPSAHRDAMFSNMLASLITHERIMTTVPKAKELRRLADRTISWGAKVGTLTAKPRDKRTAAEKARIVHAMRMARRLLKSEAAIEKLFGEVAPRFSGRAGGYTRVLKAWNRRGDAAPMAFVELVVMAEGGGTVEAAPAPAEDKPAKAAKAKADKPAKAKAEKAEAKAEGADDSEAAEKPAKAKKAPAKAKSEKAEKKK